MPLTLILIALAFAEPSFRALKKWPQMERITWWQLLVNLSHV